MMRPFQPKSVYLLALAALFTAGMIIVFPAQGFEASLRGISIWWDILFPALFPFFVISEMLLGFGIVHFIGTLLDPLMRPLFRLPGIGGFVVAMGLASGYPVGAKLTSQLWEQKLVSREEGERLVAFTTTSDPIFLIGAVSVGFFHDVRLAGILAAAHYGGAILLGLLMRFRGKPYVALRSKEPGSLLQRSFRAMHEARLRDGRPLGTLLQQATQSSIQLIFVIGGLVVFFSVVLRALDISHIMEFLTALVSYALHDINLPLPLAEAIVNGFFEVTLGAKAAGFAVGAISLQSKVAVAAFILSWGGLSVHAQIVSILHRTDLRYTPFLIARLLHGLFASALVLLFWKPMQSARDASALSSPRLPMLPANFPWSSTFTASFLFFIAILLFMTVLLMICSWGKRVDK
jgi:sporulation integral membrane protein YlbJ